MSKAKYFEGVIGQTRAKRELSFRLDNHRNGSMTTPFPHLLLTGGKGNGKSHLARKIAKNLPDFGDGSRKHKAFYSVNGSAWKNLRVFFEEYCLQFADGDKYCTIFVDEAHEIPKGVQNMLLTVLENNAQNCTSVDYEGATYIFDFNKVTFIFATTEDDKILEPLVDRLMKISLEDYSSGELAEIISGVVGDTVQIPDDVLTKASEYVRRNARKADQLAKDIISFGVPVFEMKHLDKLITATNLHPLGLEIPEVETLRILEEAGMDGLRMGQLASKLGRPPKALQRAIEPYILSLGLMEIDTVRRITQKGRDYLANLSGKKVDKPENVL